MVEVRSVATKYSVRDGGHYTPGMIHNGTLYISGQLSIDPETGKVPKGGFNLTQTAIIKIIRRNYNTRWLMFSKKSTNIWIKAEKRKKNYKISP